MLVIIGPRVLDTKSGHWCIAVLPQRHLKESLESLLLRTRYTKFGHANAAD